MQINQTRTDIDILQSEMETAPTTHVRVLYEDMRMLKSKLKPRHQSTTEYYKVMLYEFDIKNRAGVLVGLDVQPHIYIWDRINSKKHSNARRTIYNV